MRSIKIRVLVTGAAAIAIGVCAETNISEKNAATHDPVSVAVAKSVKWLVSVQGKDGGWGQDGGETSYVRQGERLESNGNDVANTAVAAEALLHTGNTPTSGPYHQSLQRAVAFILEHVEHSPAEGLAVTDVNGTQIQRKLGPYIDTFLTSKLLADLDGKMGNAQDNARVRTSLQKCVAKMEKSQLEGRKLEHRRRVGAHSGHIAGVAEPVCGECEGRGGAAEKPWPKWTRIRRQTLPDAVGGHDWRSGHCWGRGGRNQHGTSFPPTAGAAMSAEVSAVSAGVPLYKRAQEMEQLSRTRGSQEERQQINAIETELSDPRFVTGFGSIGGEEFFSYLNISDSLHRAGGRTWHKWNQRDDGQAA